MTDVDSTPNAYQESLPVSKPAQNPRSQHYANQHVLSTWCWGERPGGMKVRFKVRVETGKKAAALNAQQAEAIKELLEWARQHRKHL